MREENENKNFIIKVLLENERTLIKELSSTAHPQKHIRNIIDNYNSENKVSPDLEFKYPKKFVNWQAAKNTHAIETNNCFDLLSETGDEDNSKFVDAVIEARREKTDKKSNSVEKTTFNISDSVLKRVSGAKLSRDINKKERIELKSFP